MNEFKAGDMVYSPTEGVKVFTAFEWNESDNYLIGAGEKTFTECGMYLHDDHYPSIFHATKENQALLEALYGVKFDDPPMSDKEKVILALQGAKGKPVLCLVRTDVNDNEWRISAIGSYSYNHFHPTHGSLHYREAKPLSPDEFVLA